MMSASTFYFDLVPSCVQFVRLSMHCRLLGAGDTQLINFPSVGRRFAVD